MNDYGFRSRNVQLCFANCGTRVLRTMGFAHFQEHIGGQWFLPEVHLAVKHCVKHQMARNEVLRSWSKDGMPSKDGALGLKPLGGTDLESQLADYDE